MKTILAATAVLLSATAGAYADSSILDVYQQPTVQQGLDYSATASIGSAAYDIRNPRLGDGAPVVDLTSAATVSAGLAAPALVGARLGDGAPK